MSKCLAIITARGGSKRIPHKNIKLFCGKPIISYSIIAACSSGIFEEVMVSTDDEEIARISKQYGATVPFMRSKSNSNDFATTSDVLLEVVDSYGNQGAYFDEVCCIYPTAPFLTGDKLKNAYSKFKANNFDALIPIVPFSYPPLRGFVLDDDLIKYKWPKYEKVRSQDIEKIYHDAGQFYFSTTDSLVKNRSLIGEKTTFYELSELEVQDIDTEDDWRIAELKFKMMNV